MHEIDRRVRHDMGSGEAVYRGREEELKGIGAQHRTQAVLSAETENLFSCF